MTQSQSASADVANLKQQCLVGARILWRELIDVYGHVSCRVPERSGYVLKMIRLPPPSVDPDRVMTFDLDARCVDGGHLASSPVQHREVALHASQQFRPRLSS